MQGMKRPRVPLPTEADEEGSGEDADKGANAPEQQTIRASSRIRTPAMKPEDSDFILTHELGRKAPASQVCIFKSIWSRRQLL